jgi:pimeloyl-ACP methyl ester carboxylesterase
MPRLTGPVLLLATLSGPLQAQEPDGRVQAVLANGYRFAYVESGSGRPVVLMHGALGDYRSWDSVLKVGGSSAHFIAYSRRYHAPNPWRPDDPPAGYETSAADLAAIIRALRLDRPVLVGYSWGGGVALQVALRYPDLVGGIVLAEPVADSMIEDSTERGRTAARTRETYAQALAQDPDHWPASAVRSLIENWRGAGACWKTRTACGQARLRSRRSPARPSGVSRSRYCWSGVRPPLTVSGRLSLDWLAACPRLSVSRSRRPVTTSRWPTRRNSVPPSLASSTLCPTDPSRITFMALRQASVPVHTLTA